MHVEKNRRSNPRLRLSYPIRIRAAGERESRSVGHTVTHDLSARGAYFCTFDGGQFAPGMQVEVVISVPHRLGAAGREVTLDLRGEGEIVRVESPSHRLGGEDGVMLTGVALKLTTPLAFHYCWV